MDSRDDPDGALPTPPSPRPPLPVRVALSPLPLVPCLPLPGARQFWPVSLRVSLFPKVIRLTWTPKSGPPLGHLALIHRSQHAKALSHGAFHFVLKSGPLNGVKRNACP